ncbi:MAG: ABC transporter ATP-binding protein [Alphaproteobacteria bacterium]
MIDIKDLVFEYPTKRALHGISCEIKAGSITALVGPNGAGKTTLIRCIVGLHAPFSGTVTLDGMDVHRYPRECHRRMAYLSDFFGVYDGLTVRQCLTYTARAYGVDEKVVPEAVLTAAERLAIEDRLHQKSGELSRGLRQRLAIAQAIIHRPQFLVLDEPASGLDPEARHSLSNLLIGLRASGMTLLVSSHILAELESYCTDMLIMRDGRVSGERGLGVTQVAGGAKRLKIELAHAFPSLEQQLAALPGVAEVKLDGLAVGFVFAGDAQAQHALLKRLVTLGVPVTAFGEDRLGLQDVYLAHLRDEAARRPEPARAFPREG